MIRKLLTAAVATVALAVPAFAHEPCCTYKKVTCYETVVSYETRQEAYTKCITLYDSCYRPYTVHRTFYRDVQVPVKKVVAVTKLVKVCY